MTISVCCTINDRPVSVLDTVFSSIREQPFDELVVVLDRTPGMLSRYIRDYWRNDPRARFVDIAGEPGWRSPVKAWNRGFEAVTGDLLYCFSSETVQQPWNIESARTILTEHPNWLVFGKAECSCGPYGHEVNWNGTAPGNLLCDSEHPRPLGFIWAARTEHVRAVGGFDEAFADGFWFDDNDFFLRLWRQGLDFAFDDAIRGTHLHHERPGLSTPAGLAGIQRNQALMLQKHGPRHTFDTVSKELAYAPGRTVWQHSKLRRAD